VIPKQSLHLEASCAGLTRASIPFVKNTFTKRMDCRVKPGNDGFGVKPAALSSMGTGGMRRAAVVRNGSLTIIVLTPLTTIFEPRSLVGGTCRQGIDFVGVFLP
jgi:hypothetical protein